MGYRSTFVTTACSVKIPAWFVEKYARCVYCYQNTDPEDKTYASFPISSKVEGKMYGMFGELKADIQRILDELPEDAWSPRIGLAILHEDCEYEIVQIRRNTSRISTAE